MGLQAYKKLGNNKKMLKPDSSVVLPLVFKGKFLPLMKALLLSRVIAEAPLCNANGIRGLLHAKVAFEAKGYEGKGPHEAAHHHAPPMDAQAHGAVRPQKSISVIIEIFCHFRKIAKKNM